MRKRLHTAGRGSACSRASVAPNKQPKHLIHIGNIGLALQIEKAALFLFVYAPKFERNT